MQRWQRWALGFGGWFGQQQFALLASAFLLLVLAGSTVGSMQTRAVFTAVAVNSTTLEAGTVIIGASASHAFLNASAMLPGEATSAPITMANTGTLDFRYSISTTATDPDGKALASQLRLTIKADVPDCTSAAIDTAGTPLYDGPVASVADGITKNSVLGNPRLGEDPGDRRLNSSLNETLCFRVMLPPETGGAFQAAGATVAFVFDAEQFGNNP
ncbi:MAG: hypothetical protein NTZ05_11525 [Chloroflexi bacterium]|nr:hypothetical protein [Chloroflexota bacterium]